MGVGRLGVGGNGDIAGVCFHKSIGLPKGKLSIKLGPLLAQEHLTFLTRKKIYISATFLHVILGSLQAIKFSHGQQGRVVRTLDSGGSHTWLEYLLCPVVSLWASDYISFCFFYK